MTLRIALLNDHERQALALADWSPVRQRAELDVFHEPITTAQDAIERLAGYDAIGLIRERMALPAQVLRQLPRLRFIGVTGPWNRALDVKAALDQGIVVSHTTAREGGAHATAELAWGLALALLRQIVRADQQLRAGHWDSRLGRSLHGMRLGLIGLGRIGQRMATIGRAFGMDVVAWSHNLSADDAARHGAQRVELDELLRSSDLVSLHVILGDRTRGLIGREQLALMKPSAILVNTARGPIVDEDALFDALSQGRIAGAGLDVFDQEPLPAGHRFTQLPNVVLTPHLGFSTEGIFRGYYQDTIENLLAWMDGHPIRPLAPSA